MVTQQQEQIRLKYGQTYSEARDFAGTLLGKLESVDIDEMMSNVGKDPTINRLKQLRQTITDS